MSKAPLSSAAIIPLTADTRQMAVALGLNLDEIEEATEAVVRDLIAVKQGAVLGDVPPPSCYGSEYDPRSALCDGCVFHADCWRQDVAYLRRVKNGGDLPPPVYASPDAITQRIAWAESQEDDTVNLDHVPETEQARLKALGYDRRQIARMVPATRAFILTNDRKAVGVSISKSGKFIDVEKSKVEADKANITLSMSSRSSPPAAEPANPPKKRRTPPRRKSSPKRRKPPRRKS